MTRLPSTFVKNYASPLMKQYMDQCPFLGANRGIVSSVVNDNQISNKAEASCPFLKEVQSPHFIKPVAPQINADIIDNGNLTEDLNRLRLTMC